MYTMECLCVPWLVVLLLLVVWVAARWPAARWPAARRRECFVASPAAELMAKETARAFEKHGERITLETFKSEVENADVVHYSRAKALARKGKLTPAEVEAFV